MSATMRAFASKHPEKVLDWYKDGEGYYDVMMNKHCDDGDHGRHAIIDRNVNDVIKRIRQAVPCNCGACPAK